MGRHSHRAPSVADSMAEYFDASEVIVCESSSEAEASDESGLSDITTTSTSEPEEGHGECFTSRPAVGAYHIACLTSKTEDIINFLLSPFQPLPHLTTGPV